VPILVVDHLKNEKNKMAKFDLKKWIVENRYGKQPSHSNYSKKPIKEELATFLDILDSIGSAASSAKRGGTTAGGVNEQEEEGGDNIDVDKIEDELESIFDIPGDNCPVEEEEEEEKED